MKRNVVKENNSHVVQQERLERDVIELKTDVVLNEKNRSIGIGVVARDYKGKALVIKDLHMKYLLTPFCVELQVILKACKMVDEL